MRVLFFLPDIEAGVATIVKTIINYLPKAKKKNCELILYRNKEDNHKTFVDDLEGVQVHRMTYSANENAYAIFRKLNKFILSDKDIIVSNDVFELRMVVALKLTNPVVYVIHGDFDYYYLLLKLYHTIINTIITYSSHIEKKVLDMYPGKKEIIKKIYYPAASVDSMPQTIPKPEGFNILFAGLLIERKGAHILKEIFDNCVALGMKNFHLQIIGNGEFYDILVEKFKGQKNVTIAGWQPTKTVLEAMEKAHVFLFPSNAEGLPNVLVEALSRGAVPVSTNLESGVQDILEDGVNGILVAEQDSLLFAKAIHKLYENRQLIDKMNSAAYKGLQKFSPHVQAAEYYQSFVAALSNHHKHHRAYPQHSMGGILNKSWLPDWFVQSVRRAVQNKK
jgi:glycosyltransferase involved in cell wall biosynthesis